MKSKYSILLIVVWLLSSCSHRQDPVKNSNSNQDKDEIKAVIETYTDAFNRKDFDKLASLWQQEAVLENPVTGETAEGQEEIKNYYKRKAEEHKESRLKLGIDDIVFTNPDNADVNSHFQVFEKDTIKAAGKLRIGFVKENGKWQIANFAEFEKLPISSQFDKLEDFNWFVGKWVNEDENVEFDSEWKWDDHKNFLTENFALKILGDKDFEGFQIIGWDPAKEKIRSWVFDSDGGFGEGTVEKQGDSWYASMVYTLPDGGTGSSTNIYKKVDDDTYTFSSVGRDIDGTVLPNIGPYKITRKK